MNVIVSNNQNTTDHILLKTYTWTQKIF